MPTIEVQNLAEITSLLNRVRGGFNERDVGKVLFDRGAKPLKAAIAEMAPRGPTGNLRRAVQAYIARQRYGLPAAYVKVNREIAPHLHLVTMGTKPHDAGKWKAMKITGGSMQQGGAKGADFIRKHPGSKANLYFGETWARMQTLITDAITRGLGDLFDKAAK